MVGEALTVLLPFAHDWETGVGDEGNAGFANMALFTGADADDTVYSTRVHTARLTDESHCDQPRVCVLPPSLQDSDPQVATITTVPANDEQDDLDLGILLLEQLKRGNGDALDGRRLAEMPTLICH